MPTIFILFLFAAASAYIARTEKQIRVSALVFAILGGGSSLYLAVMRLLVSPYTPVSGWFRADMYTWFMIALVSFVYITATIASVRYTGEESREGLLTIEKLRVYFFSIPLFILAMLVSVLANHLGLLWIGLEGTTLTTTLLVALYRKDASIEAAWKFIMLCSIGIGLGMIGMLMFVHAGVVAGLNVFDAFSYSTLRTSAHLLDPASMKLAFVFLLVGIGTKVGFVPMHTWLPDAHSKTPSPISALLSGVLLNVAFFVLLRCKVLTDLSIGSSAWSDHLMIGFGVLSVVVAAFFLLQQRNYKRMLAYSSVEHMGLMGFASGLGPVGMLALTIHAVFHTLTKSALFFTSGEILLSQKTTKIAGIKNLMKKTPITATLFLLGILAIIAVPPSGLFTSEFMIVGAGLQSARGLTLVLLLALTMIAFSMLKSTTSMLYTADDGVVEHTHKEKWTLTHAVVIVQLILIVVLGLFITTAPVLDFFKSISQSI
ncbi:MAG: proton-conducting transporter membrane subunit [Candidatus Uhrbacteria bacterium]|nr:proton-conducting transporter membrane subunit [Candidatus Uhrbacteria bacterium]